MNPAILGVIGPGFLNQLPTLSVLLLLASLSILLEPRNPSPAESLVSRLDGLGFRVQTTQSLQNPLTKEYTLNNIRDPIII